MAGLKIVLDKETLDALERRAQSERRPLDWQAEVLLRQSLGLPFPLPKDSEAANKESQNRKAG
jgi:hypothetical protein